MYLVGQMTHSFGPKLCVIRPIKYKKIQNLNRFIENLKRCLSNLKTPDHYHDMGWLFFQLMKSASFHAENCSIRSQQKKLP